MRLIIATSYALNFSLVDMRRSRLTGTPRGERVKWYEDEETRCQICNTLRAILGEKNSWKIFTSIRGSIENLKGALFWNRDSLEGNFDKLCFEFERSSILRFFLKFYSSLDRKFERNSLKRTSVQKNRSKIRKELYFKTFLKFHSFGSYRNFERNSLKRTSFLGFGSKRSSFDQVPSLLCNFYLPQMRGCLKTQETQNSLCVGVYLYKYSLI